MRKQSSFLLLWLLCLDNIRVVQSQANQQQRRRREKRQGDDPRFQQREQNDERNEKDSKFKEDFYEYLRNQNVTDIRRFNKPKHVVEAVWNSVVYSGGLFVSGAVTMVGMPVAFLWSAFREKSELRAGDWIGRLIGGTLIGGIIGSVAWFIGAVYLLIQVVSGIVATPRALWAWIEGRVDYQEHDGVWRFYNLTQHFETLASPLHSSNGNVQDNSFYELLGVETTASPKEIKRAYYKLAKESHPDKNPDDQDNFLKIHQAYETLYDDDQRQLYDEWGSNASSNPNMFDPGIFVDVFFGVSPELESYIGDLAIKSFMKTMSKIVYAQQQTSEAQKEEMVKDLLSALRVNHSRDVRQVDIALFLTEFTKDYVASNMNEDEFRVKCQEEASRLFESTPFPEKMLQPIGSALYWEGGYRSLKNPLGLPLSSVAWTRGRVKGIRKWIDYGTDIYQFYIKVKASHDEAIEKLSHSTKNSRRKRHQSEEEEKKSTQLETFKIVLPEMLEFFWKFNAHDITHTLKGACWKVLYSNTCPNKRRQSKALLILGQTILKAAETIPNHNDICAKSSTVGKAQSAKKSTSDTCNNTGFMDIQARFEMALQMATKGG